MDRDRLPLRTLLDFYLVSCRAANLSPRTVTWYEEKIGRFIGWLAPDHGEAALRELSPRAVERFIGELRAQRKWTGHPFTPPRAGAVSASYVQGFVRALRAWASWLERAGYTDGNRLARVRPPKANPPLIQPLTRDEMERVVAACQSDRDRALVLTALDTGLRASELVGLRADEARVEQHPGTLIVLGKGGRQRLVPVGPQAQRALQRYKFGDRAEVAAAPSDRLFLTRRGRAFGTAGLKMVFERLRHRSGVAGLHPHLLRHTFATQYLENGGDLFSLQMILGHRSLEMVRRYAHLANSHVIERHREYSPVEGLGLGLAATHGRRRQRGAREPPG